MTPMTWLLIGVLWWMFFWLYQPLLVDRLRFQLFALRDRLFLLAADGKIAFDSPTYQSTRETLNSIIRFSHRIGAAEIVAIALVSKPSKASEPAAAEHLSDDAQQALNQIRVETVMSVSRFLLLSSPMILVVASVAGVAMLIRNAARRFMSIGGSAVPRQDFLKRIAKAFIERCPNLPTIPHGRVAA